MTARTNGAAPTYVDLHMHSTASDGHLAPEAVVAAARTAGLAAIALTDHDTAAGVPAARAAGEAIGMRVIAGAELSATEPSGEEIHLLALHLDDLGAIESTLARFRDDRVTRAERMVAQLNALGVPVSMDAVLAAAGGGAVGRPHVARALVGGGHVRDFREAFDRYLAYGRPGYVAKPVFSPAQAIAVAHEAGGICVWAHPGAAGRREAVERLVAQGIDGLEVRHPSHSPDDTQRLQALVDFFQLVPSGGSDWHGLAEGPRALGGMQVPAEVLEAQDARVATRRRG